MLFERPLLRARGKGKRGGARVERRGNMTEN
jgi:hypothetical protein